MCWNLKKLGRYGPICVSIRPNREPVIDRETLFCEDNKRERPGEQRNGSTKGQEAVSKGGIPGLKAQGRVPVVTVRKQIAVTSKDRRWTGKVIVETQVSDRGAKAANCQETQSSNLHKYVFVSSSVVARDG